MPLPYISYIIVILYKWWSWINLPIIIIINYKTPQIKSVYLMPKLSSVNLSSGNSTIGKKSANHRGKIIPSDMSRLSDGKRNPTLVAENTPVERLGTVSQLWERNPPATCHSYRPKNADHYLLVQKWFSPRFRIRFHFLRIQIQDVFSKPDPDPSNKNQFY